MKKLLHIALKNAHGTNETMTPAFISAGYIVREIDWTKFNKAELNRTILYVAESFKPDIVFMQIQEGNIIDFATAQKLSEKSLVINWTGDVRESTEWYEQLAPHIGVTLFTNETDVEKLRVKGLKADYLQVGFDRTIFKPSKIKQQFPEIVFLGNNYFNSNNINFPLSKERIEMVEYMTHWFSKRFKIYGYNWEKIFPQYRDNHLASIHQGENNGIIHLSPHQENICYSNCKIAINQNHFDYKKFSSDRILRIMGSGAFCLTKYFEGIEEEYENKKHLVWWKTFDELGELCNYYLAPENQSERIKIAKQGCEHVHEKCTWDYRFENELTEIINKYSKQNGTTENKPRKERFMDFLSAHDTEV